MSIEWTTEKPTEPGWYFEKTEGIKGYWLSRIYKKGGSKLYITPHAFCTVGTDEERLNDYIRAMVRGHSGTLQLWHGPIADPETEHFVE